MLSDVNGNYSDIFRIPETYIGELQVVVGYGGIVSTVGLTVERPLNPPVDITLETTHVSIYGGNDGNITITASGGSGIYEYSINNEANWQDSGLFDNLTAGTYKVLARDKSDTDNVSGARSVIITQPQKPSSGSDEDSDGSSDPDSSNGSNNTRASEPEKEEDGSVVVTVPEPEVNTETGKARTEIKADELEKAFEMAEPDNEGVKNVEVRIPEIDEAVGYQIELPREALETNGGRVIKIKTGIGGVELSGDMLENQSEGESGNVSLNFERVEKEELTTYSKINNETRGKIGDRPVIEISLTENGKIKSWENKNSPATISIPYTLKQGEDPEHVVVWYIDGEGNPFTVPNGRYNPDTGMVEFQVTHFSIYAVAYVEKTFDDLDGYAWARHQAEVLASKGIIFGTGNDCYSPEKSITRADFLSLMVRTLELEEDFESSFNDVRPGEYYYNPVGTAKQLGIIAGIGGNLFKPTEYISRQDMMVMTHKALMVKELMSNESGDSVLEGYRDISDISSYALESVTMLVSRGIIVGSSNRIKPLENLSRAEAAVIMYKLYNME